MLWSKIWSARFSCFTSREEYPMTDRPGLPYVLVEETATAATITVRPAPRELRGKSLFYSTAKGDKPGRGPEWERLPLTLRRLADSLAPLCGFQLIVDTNPSFFRLTIRILPVGDRAARAATSAVLPQVIDALRERLGWPNSLPIYREILVSVQVAEGYETAALAAINQALAALDESDASTSITPTDETADAIS
jgi:hypothetical protein